MDTKAIKARIRAESIRQGLDPAIALATAEVESGFKPGASGDLQWYLDQQRFERVVPRDNPYRTQRELWHSYGLFQLLAPYHVNAGEDPRVLHDPNVNIKRGVRALARLAKRHGNDTDAIRIAYTGASRASLARRREIVRKFSEALAKYRGVG